MARQGVFESFCTLKPALRRKANLVTIRNSFPSETSQAPQAARYDKDLNSQAFLPQNNPANPRALHAIPPIRSQVALFVGDPVNAREKPEPIELFALIPKIIRTIPTASNARLIADFLFIFVSSLIHVRFPGL